MVAALPTLETKRLVPRPFEMADAPAVQALASARQIAETTLNLPHPYPEDGAATWIAGHPGRIEKRQYTFAVVGREDRVLVGSMGIGVDPTHHKGELGYWVGVPYGSQGYATEAARRVIQRVRGARVEPNVRALLSPEPGFGAGDGEGQTEV